MIFPRIVCFFKGHKRGKLVGGGEATPLEGAGVRWRTFSCPRCGNRTTYKVKPKDQNHGTSGEEA